MRIISIRWEPVARVLCVVYAFFGLLFFLIFAFTDAPELTLPFGIVAPLFHFNFNLKLPRSTSFTYNVFLGFLAVFAYALS
jgi:hypothetical protein